MNTRWRNFFHQCILAGGAFLAVAIFAEHLIPGSILAYLNIYWFIAAFGLAAILSPPASRRPHRFDLGWLFVLILNLSLLSFVTLRKSGHSGMLLAVAIDLFVVAAAWSLIYPKKIH